MTPLYLKEAQVKKSVTILYFQISAKVLPKRQFDHYWHFLIRMAQKFKEWEVKIAKEANIAKVAKIAKFFRISNV